MTKKIQNKRAQNLLNKEKSAFESVNSISNTEYRIPKHFFLLTHRQIYKQKKLQLRNMLILYFIVIERRSSHFNNLKLHCIK